VIFHTLSSLSHNNQSFSYLLIFTYILYHIFYIKSIWEFLTPILIINEDNILASIQI
jgi:hypothetical protein